MEKREIRLYNMILPLWLLWIFPHVWLLILPGALLLGTEVLLCALLALRRPHKGRLMKRLWWRIWWRGFAADAAGVAWLLLALILWDMNVSCRRAFWQKWLEGVMGDPFSHPVAFLWTLAAVAIAGVCIYYLDKKPMRAAGLTDREAHRAALPQAILTPPRAFLNPTPN